MNHYYCKYNQSKVIKISWEDAAYDIDDLKSITDIQVGFEAHMEDLKNSGKSLPCFKANICSIKIKGHGVAFLIFYDVIENAQVGYNGDIHADMTIRKVRQGALGSTCYSS